MNISSASSSPSGLLPGVLAPSGAAGSSEAATAGSSADPASDLPGVAQSASAGLQTAASYVQTASAYLGRIEGILAQMGDLAHGQPNADAAFTGLQGDLRAIIGGSAQEIGGSKEASQAGASFNGADLFGPSAGLTVTSGSAASPTLSVGSPNLRQGALRILISQDAAGAFAVGRSDAGAPATVSEAAHEVGAAGSALASAGGALQATAAGAYAADPASSLTASEARALVRAAAGALASQPEAARAAQAPALTPSVLSLLQVA
jgi:hypothetical protein